MAVDLDGREDIWIHVIQQNDGSYLEVIRDMDVNARERRDIKQSLNGERIPKSGVLITILTPDNDVIVHSFTPPAEVVENRNNIVVRIFEKLDEVNAKFKGNDSEGRELEGEEGLKTYSKTINDIGIVLQYTPLAPLGILLNTASDVIETGLDFKNGNPDAVNNTVVRVGTTFVGGVAGGMVKKLPVKEFNKQTIEGAINQGGEVIEDGKTK